MKHRFSYKAIALIMLIGALGLFSVPAIAQMQSDMSNTGGSMQSTQGMQSMQQSQPGAFGAGPSIQASASSVGNQAWVYTGSPTVNLPVRTTGNFSLNAFAPTQAAAANNATATFTATFAYPPNGSQYLVQFTCLQPSANVYGVGINKNISGASIIPGVNLPQTTAQVIINGRVGIAQNGQVVATNVPAVFMESQALHDVNGGWLATPAEDRQEGTLVIMNAGSAAGFPSGNLFVFWPNTSYQISSTSGTSGAGLGAGASAGSIWNTGTSSESGMGTGAGTGAGMSASSSISSSTTTTGSTASSTAAGPATIGNALFGTGPALPVAGSTAPVGQLTIDLASTGPQVKSSTTIPGLYDVTVTNSGTSSAGIELTGVDLCCTIYKRFSNVIRPGQSQTFKWFFAPGRVTFRTFHSAAKTVTAYSNVRYTGQSTSLTFQVP